MEINYYIPASLFIVCLALRGAYELLKEAHKIQPQSKPVFAFILTVMLVLWVSWFILCPLDPMHAVFPEFARWIGLAIFSAGLVLAIGALIQLRGVENIDHLVTTGFFKKIRHPMYVGFIAWILGWSLLHSAPVSLGIGIIGIGSVLWWRHLEEARLKQQFGTAYDTYRLTTWF
jgi:protein-S-isoprenylcysteine O-methyltransferase Ste14